ncbi:MAG: helix-turn-helix domain-containing protein [Planctomycetota bacterium]
MRRYGRLRGDDIESICDGPDLWVDDAQQLSAGALGLRVEWAHLPGLSVYVFRYGAALRIATECVADGVILNLCLASDSAPRIGPSSIDEADVHFQSRTDHLDDSVPERTEVLAVHVDASLARELGWSDERPAVVRGCIGANRGLVAASRRALEVCARLAGPSDGDHGVALALRDSILARLGDVLAACGTPRQAASDERPVRRAYDLVLSTEEIDAAAPADARPSVPELAAHLDVSQSTLHRAFERWTGMPPARYLGVRRLHRFRRALLAEVPVRGAITRAAIASGYDHLGRLSADYRRHFGESPSATLDRVTRSVGP